MNKPLISSMIAMTIFTATATSAIASDKLIAGPIVAPNHSFVDVSDKHWASNAVYALQSLGIIHGIDANHFAPLQKVTKAQFIQMVIELGYKSGALTPRQHVAEPTEPYEDVQKTDWFYGSVVDAFDRGFIDTSVKFNPNEPIAREEAVIILSKYFSDASGSDLNLRGDVIKDYPYADVSEASLAGSNAALYLTHLGLVNGKLDNANHKVFDFKGQMTRAEAAELLYVANSKYLDLLSHKTYKEGEATFEVNKTTNGYTITGTLDKLPIDGYSIAITGHKIQGNIITVSYTITEPNPNRNDVGEVVSNYSIKTGTGANVRFNFEANQKDTDIVLTENGVTFTMVHKQDDLTIFADMGEQPTTGYAVKIKGISFEPNDVVMIQYSVQKPQPGQLQGQIVMHPTDTFSNRVDIGKNYTYRLQLIDAAE
ncbi:S-layer family protein [Paenibacillus taihuensis]|uniref:S-layer family protein n=1 Tax=Paenibacillus taihuensis TaxID=1156355 RepID=A0A3D9RPV0_9BACL|nr:S-layer homology domain-containing protein [Paenibacillus taihuensis]REE77714.1 S-layer family protein [Paenibacillus taihuensis]